MLRQRRTLQLTKHRLHASALSSPFLLLLLLASACCSVHSQCTSNYLTKTPVVDPNIKVTAPDGRSSFWFFTTPVNWCTAEASCKDHGGHLASVLTSAENQLVLDTCFNKLISDPEGGCWIGLNDINTEGTYQWTDNSTVYYTGWYTGSDFRQPDDATQADNEDCVFAIKAFVGWHDRSCDALYSYVCRVPVSANTTLPPSPPSGVAASVAKPAEVPGLQPTPPTVAPPPQPPPENKTDWRVVVATVAPILTGTAALMAIAYTGWKWWHKRKATLERKKVQSMAIGMYDAGIKPAGVKPVDAV